MYTSRAHRDSGWWVVQNDQFPGAISQVRRLDQAPAAQREAIAFVAGIDQDAVEVSVRAQLAPDLSRSLEEAVALRREAEAKEARSLDLRRGVAADLQSEGLTLRDIAVVLGVSYQRVHQLLHDQTESVASRAS